MRMFNTLPVTPGKENVTLENREAPKVKADYMRVKRTRSPHHHHVGGHYVRRRLFEPENPPQGGAAPVPVAPVANAGPVDAVTQSISRLHV
jgi:hypothetical protein